MPDISTINGVAIASVAEVNSVAVANISTIMGITKASAASTVYDWDFNSTTGTSTTTFGWGIRVYTSSDMSNLLFIDCVVTAAGYGIYGGNSDSVSYKSCAAIRCMIFAGQGCYYRTNTIDCISVGGFYGYYTIYRDSTDISESHTNRGLGSLYSSQGTQALPMHFSKLDSPSTTSSITYTVQFRTSSGQTVYYGETDGTTTTLIPMEIGA